MSLIPWSIASTGVASESNWSLAHPVPHTQAIIVLLIAGIILSFFQLQLIYAQTARNCHAAKPIPPLLLVTSSRTLFRGLTNAVLLLLVFTNDKGADV